MKQGKLLAGLMVGLAAGAVLGLLFAPEKGSKTRKKISRLKEDYSDLVKEKYDEMKDTLKQKYEHTVKEGQELLSKGTSKLNDLKKDVREMTS